MKINNGSFFQGNNNINFSTLPQVIQKQYAFLPGIDARVNVEGNTTIIDYPNFVGFLLSIVKLIGVDLPHKATDVDTTLSRWSTNLDLENTFWERIFHYTSGKTVVLKSKFKPTTTGAVETFKYGLTFEMTIEQIEDGIIFKGEDLSIAIKGLKIPIPNWLGLGKLVVIQKAVDNESYKLTFEFIHPIFKRTYYFEGIYKLTEG